MIELSHSSHRRDISHHTTVLPIDLKSLFLGTSTKRLMVFDELSRYNICRVHGSKYVERSNEDYITLPL